MTGAGRLGGAPPQSHCSNSACDMRLKSSAVGIGVVGGAGAGAGADAGAGAGIVRGVASGSVGVAPTKIRSCAGIVPSIARGAFTPSKVATSDTNDSRALGAAII